MSLGSISHSKASRTLVKNLLKNLLGFNLILHLYFTVIC